MAVSVELIEIGDPEVRQGVESAIRACIGERPEGEDWKLWVMMIAGHYQVTVKGPNQTRRRLFFDNEDVLPEKIRGWLEAYPFR